VADGSDQWREHRAMLNQRARRRGEQGQALIMALAFIVFFGLVTTAVLQLADTVELQQSRSQADATSNADINGAMLFAAQAAKELGGCVVGASGSITMTSGAVASYITDACNPGATADLIADGCSVYDDSVSVTTSSGQIPLSGRVLVASDCSGHSTGIMSIAYDS
jgi:Tfp pilus assembly protein PilX